jgi:hypothetical protein
MSTLFLVCAILGGTLLVLQLLLGLAGLGGGIELDDDPASKDAMHLLSTRSLSAGAAFFGIGGLAAGALGAPALLALLVALAAGACAAVGTAALMSMLTRLESDGVVQLERALGEPGTVYLRVPGQRAGTGKVLLSVQNRTVECQAVTSLDEIPTGAAVIVVDILGPDMVEVAPAPTLGGLLDGPA